MNYSTRTQYRRQQPCTLLSQPGNTDSPLPPHPEPNRYQYLNARLNPGPSFQKRSGVCHIPYRTHELTFGSELRNVVVCVQAAKPPRLTDWKSSKNMAPRPFRILPTGTRKSKRRGCYPAPGKCLCGGGTVNGPAWKLKGWLLIARPRKDEKGLEKKQIYCKQP